MEKGFAFSLDFASSKQLNLLKILWNKVPGRGTGFARKSRQVIKCLTLHLKFGKLVARVARNHDDTSKAQFKNFQ